MHEIEIIKEEVNKIFKHDSSGHDAEHTLRVYKMAMKLAEREQCDRRVIAIAALLHDVDDPKLFTTADYANARRIMADARIDEETLRQVIRIIAQVSYKGRDSEVPDSIEGKIVQDADRLDAMGAIGIARAFAYGGAKGRVMYDPAIKPMQSPDKEEYLSHRGTSINHFYEKLFLLKDMMNTPYAKELAKKRDAFMHQYIDEFMQEWEGEKLTEGTFEFIRRDGVIVLFSYKDEWIKILLKLDANKILSPLEDSVVQEIHNRFYDEIVSLTQKLGRTRLENAEWHDCLKRAMPDYPEIFNAFHYADKQKNADIYEQICAQMKDIVLDGDRSNGSVDSSLTSSKRALIVDAVEKITYSNYHLTPEQREAYEDGYIYIHDMGHRRDSINCCLFDMETVLRGGFEMGEMWYDEPSTLNEAFDVIASISINAAAQIYGGFTIAQIDELLVKYAKLSHIQYVNEYLELGIEKGQAEALADKKLERDFENGFGALEAKFNSLISPRGDYPFITISFGLGRDKFAHMATNAALKVRAEGHGKPGFKRPVLFPKLVFLYDKNLHEDNKELNSLFKKAILCSSKVMYPEYLSLTGEKGIVADVYKKYGKVISPMCCRAFLTKWFEKGGEKPADEEDTPIFIGRFNFGVISLNLPMILAKSRECGEDYFKTLDYYLELSRQIHKSTYRFLADKKAYTNPLAFMQGGLYGGHLDRDDRIEPLLKSATASYGITALNELQRLYNGRSIVEDGEFVLNTARYINTKVAEFQAADHIQYSVYGTPAESLCGRQVKKFREKYGVIEHVSDRDYFSNSFHCHVSETITPIEKQEYEARFWDLFNGGKIQYVRIDVPHNVQALEALVKHAMELGLYEGINISLAYCENCGYQWNNERNERPEVCPRCKKNEMTLVDRMCGYIAFTRVHGKSRLNDAKMAEIKDRICM